MNNISSIHDCFGCGVCATICPKHIISIELNKHGFYEPMLDNEANCLNCGLCLKVCSFVNEGLAVDKSIPIKSYGVWSKHAGIRRSCSSGGVSFEIGKELIGRGFKVCAVKYNSGLQRAEHYIASTEVELVSSVGSKYIQSYTVDGFSKIRKGEKYLIVGTPCQIDSMRRKIKMMKMEESVVLMDFFCHSVPSMWAWKWYLKLVEKNIGEINYASWRNKSTGWHDSWQMTLSPEQKQDKIDWHDSYNIKIKEKKGVYNSRLSEGDLFYRLFLGDFCCNSACQKKCKFKYDRSSADIRIGDFWGQTYAKNEDGVSAVVAFTQRGVELMDSLPACVVVEHPFETVAEGQMKKNVGRAPFSKMIINLLQSKSLSSSYLRMVLFFSKVVRKLFAKKW